MLGRSDELVRKAVRALTEVEREDLLVELLLQRVPAVPGLVAAAPGSELATADRLAAVLGGPVDVGGPAAAMKVLPIRMPASTHERLRGFCASNGFSMAVVIRTLVERFLDQRAGESVSAESPR